MGANSAETAGGETGRRAEAGVPADGELINPLGAFVVSNGVRCGVDGSNPGPLLPGMFAVGGGANPVRPPLVVFGLCWAGLELELDAFFGDALDFGEGTPPYFSNSCWVELYFVAALSLSIV